jgi:hypothetical protein
MTLPTIDQARSWRGLTLLGIDDEPVGKIETIYVDRTTRQPEWALVNTGLFGSSRTFVPLADAAQRGEIVQVPHQTSVVREAPRLDEDAELSEEDEARLYAHYGIAYTTQESASGLPAGETTSGDGGTAASDATTELPPSSRLQADAPVAAGVAAGTGQTTTPAAGTSWSGGTTGTAGSGRNGRGKQAAAAGFGAVVLGAIAAGVTALRRRRRKPPGLGERVGQVSRDTADALARAAEEVRRQAVAATSGEGARKAAKGGRRTARKTARKAERTGRGAADAGRKAAHVAAAAGLAAAATTGRASSKAARKAAKASGKATRKAAKASRKAAEAGQAAAATGLAAAAGSGRAVGKAVKRTGKEASATVASANATVDSKRRARKRARSRKRAAAATAGAARSVATAPAAAGRKAQQKVGKQARKVTPTRRRRSKMKLGKIGMVVGAAVGYVLGAKAGRERYEQISASARQLLDKPQVKRVVDSAPGNLGARMEQVANKAADKVQQAGDKVASSGPGTSGTSGSTTGTTTTTTSPTPTSPTTTTTTPATPSTSGTSTSTTTTPSVPTTPGTTTETGTTAAKRAASERKPKNS